MIPLIRSVVEWICVSSRRNVCAPVRWLGPLSHCPRAVWLVTWHMFRAQRNYQGAVIPESSTPQQVIMSWA